VEVLVVAAILILLAGLAVPQLFRAYENARNNRLEIDARQIQAAVDREILNARIRGATVDNGFTREFNPQTEAATIAAYGINLSFPDEARFVFTYNATTNPQSWVVITVGDRTFDTRTNAWTP